MKKRDYKEQERQRRYYFFDYLFWLGEMAQRHYKGEPRRPDGESMLMLCIMIFIQTVTAILLACLRELELSQTQDLPHLIVMPLMKWLLLVLVLP